ncbi:WD repeatcontaining protein 13like, partial [Caligus rogercresseyi]
MWQDIFALDSAFMNPSSERMSANPLYLKRRMQLLSRRRPTTSKRNELSRKKKEYLSLRVELLKRTFKLPSPELLSLKNLSLNESSNSINHHPSSSSIFEEKTPIFDTHSAPISRLSFGRTSSESLFASSLDGSISLVQKLRVFSSRPSLIDAASGIRSFDLSESDEVLIIAEENCLVLRDSATGKVLRSFPDISAFAVRFLPLNNNFLVCLLR